MTPSYLRQLDELIATEIMGLVRNGGETVWSPYDKETGITRDIALRLPHYTTDPVASKQLREKLADSKKPFVWTLGYRQLVGGYVYRFSIVCDEMATFSVEAPTEELSVVLCALKAYGIHVPTEEQ